MTTARAPRMKHDFSILQETEDEMTFRLGNRHRESSGHVCDTQINSRTCGLDAINYLTKPGAHCSSSNVPSEKKLRLVRPQRLEGPMNVFTCTRADIVQKCLKLSVHMQRPLAPGVRHFNGTSLYFHSFQWI
jgi:hypothetical protein